eukprot:NODE_53_length_1964_cov_569.356015_g52_i0.p1 GENE.NODE_53_length_1964_cov_569.356015_g52_i0~~NODE_53_length_1964_cov_569.356015_g52_i0.p1  ORF type:complete len:503 (-),score=88.00 NODE_53_length_1964_cov_569.356015_g52_i0:373-1881(-)
MWTLLFCLVSLVFGGVSGKRPPNFIVVYGDDIGYGDLNVYGHPTSSTPNLDRMALEGMRFVQFYSAAPICSPSRTSLMTGRLFPRAGIFSGHWNSTRSTGSAVFNPESVGGLPMDEVTMANIFSDNGYATGGLGKWHLGIGKDGHYLPIHRGFQSYFGIPMTQNECVSKPRLNPERFGPCPIFHNETIAVQPADVPDIDAKYVNNAKDFITNNRDRPFFFYFASHHTHLPQFASKRFLNTTRRGLFGDSLAEVDWSVGEILQHLRDLQLDTNTLVVFSADNGPELADFDLGGSAGPLRCGKGTTYEGGMRVPAIFWWPGVIPPNTLQYNIASTLDISMTMFSLAGIQNKLPPNTFNDGMDITPMLKNVNATAVRDIMFYYAGHLLLAVRWRSWKIHRWTTGAGNCNGYFDDVCWTRKLSWHDPPLLYNVEQDPPERVSLLGDKYAWIHQKFHEIMVEHNRTMTFKPSEMDKGNDVNYIPCCNPGCKPFPKCCHCTTEEQPFL